MIDKSGEYWHLYFNESCDDSPTQILALVRRLFDEIAEMGDVYYMRVKPEMERHETFDDVPIVTVRCRFSAKPSVSIEGTKVVAVGLSRLTQAVELTEFNERVLINEVHSCGDLCPTCEGRCRYVMPSVYGSRGL